MAIDEQSLNDGPGPGDELQPSLAAILPLHAQLPVLLRLPELNPRVPSLAPLGEPVAATAWQPSGWSRLGKQAARSRRWIGGAAAVSLLVMLAVLFGLRERNRSAQLETAEPWSPPEAAATFAPAGPLVDPGMPVDSPLAPQLETGAASSRATEPRPPSDPAAADPAGTVRQPELNAPYPEFAAEPSSAEPVANPQQAYAGLTRDPLATHDAQTSRGPSRPGHPQTQTVSAWPHDATSRRETTSPAPSSFEAHRDDSQPADARTFEAQQVPPVDDLPGYAGGHQAAPRQGDSRDGLSPQSPAAPEPHNATARAPHPAYAYDQSNETQQHAGQPQQQPGAPQGMAGRGGAPGSQAPDAPWSGSYSSGYYRDQRLDPQAAQSSATPGRTVAGPRGYAPVGNAPVASHSLEPAGSPTWQQPAAGQPGDVSHPSVPAPQGSWGPRPDRALPSGQATAPQATPQGYRYVARALPGHPVHGAEPSPAQGPAGRGGFDREASPSRAQGGAYLVPRLEQPPWEDAP